MTKEVEVKETEFRPEQPVSRTFEDDERERFVNRMKGYAASCDVEINRIAQENGVRIGNSILNEAYAIDEVVKALKKIQDKYLYHYDIKQKK